MLVFSGYLVPSRIAPGGAPGAERMSPAPLHSAPALLAGASGKEGPCPSYPHLCELTLCDWEGKERLALRTGGSSADAASGWNCWCENGRREAGWERHATAPRLPSSPAAAQGRSRASVRRIEDAAAGRESSRRGDDPERKGATCSPGPHPTPILGPGNPPAAFGAQSKQLWEKRPFPGSLDSSSPVPPLRTGR